MTNLYEEIDRLVENRLNHANANGEKVDPSVWVAEVAENLADKSCPALRKNCDHKCFVMP